MVKLVPVDGELMVQCTISPKAACVLADLIAIAAAHMCAHSSVSESQDMRELLQQGVSTIRANIKKMPFDNQVEAVQVGHGITNLIAPDGTVKNG